MQQYSDLQRQIDEIRLALTMLPDTGALLAETRKSYASNLTGPITSTGNATAIALQTGTGVTFVMDTSPTLVTPKATTTLGVGNTTPSASGAGISFPATQSASTDANTLDDYEEGEWTPGVSFGGAAVNVTYSVQIGSYTKIGDRVLFNGRIVLTSKGISVGSALITGLPFTTNATANRCAAYSLQLNYVAATATAPMCQIPPGVATLSISQLVAGINTAYTDADFTNTTVLNFSGQYGI